MPGEYAGENRNQTEVPHENDTGPRLAIQITEVLGQWTRPSVAPPGLT